MRAVTRLWGDRQGQQGARANLRGAARPSGGSVASLGGVMGFDGPPRPRRDFVHDQRVCKGGADPLRVSKSGGAQNNSSCRVVARGP